jgi:transcriptional regulator with XRE-family HTH domain
MKIGDKIRHLRVMRDIKRETLAKELGISLRTYGDIERNISGAITPERIEKIAEIFGITAKDIEGVEDAINNFFGNNNSVLTGTNHNATQTNHYDTRELAHEIDLLKLELKNRDLEIQLLKAEKEKAELEARYWREKVEGS